MLDGIAKKPRTLKKVSQSTLAKHLRQLGSCLGAAVSEGYAEDNPVSRLHSTRRPKVSQSAPAYFTNEELLETMARARRLPLYSYLCRIALATGMRSGELIALRWSDVSMTTNEVTVSRTSRYLFAGDQECEYSSWSGVWETLTCPLPSAFMT